MKAIFRYLLCLGILLLSGYGQLAAHAPTGSAYFATPKHYKKVSSASIGDKQLHQAVIHQAPVSGSRKSAGLVEVAENEVEEVESSSSKKSLEPSHFFTTALLAWSLEYYFGYFQKSLAFCKSFSYFSSHQYFLLFRVFRI